LLKNQRNLLILNGNLRKMTTSQLIEELKRITQSNIDLVNQKFSALNEQQKNWRKDLDSWSINDVFSHLNEFSSYYHTAFSAKIERTRFREPKEVFISSPLGRSAWKSMKLGNAQNIKRKFKSPRSYNPTFNPSLVSTDSISKFEKNQQELVQIIDLAATINLRKAKIAISISKIVRLKFGDALLFVVYHNERHLQQALNILNHRNFPLTNA
jgi:hypothetical protein